MAFERELSAVQEWLDRTDAVALEHFTAGAAAEIKADGTPVTEADRAVERLIREAVDVSFPGDAVLGEEHGEAGDSSRRWIIDPIDGTKNFSRGVPAFATLLGLEVDGDMVLGAVSAPALRTRWWATSGDGAFRNGTRVRVSPADDLAAAQVCAGDVIGYGEPRRLDAFVDLCRKSARFRAFGDFWGHMLVAQGSMEIMVEFADLSVWDLAAVAAIVTEAGGRVTGLDGRANRSGPTVSTNGLLHERVLELLG